MRLKDIKIRTQLLTGFFLILLFVIVLGFTAFYQGTKLWQNTASLNEHPLTVRRAIGEIEVNLLLIHNSMNAIILSENAQETEEIIKNIDTYDANAHANFDIVYDRYLGPKSDIDIAYNQLVSYKTARDETIRIYHSGNKKEAAARNKENGAGQMAFNKLFGSIDTISVFARAKGDEFYNTSRELNNSLTIQLSIITAAILLLSSIIIYILNKSIKDPLVELNIATDRFRRGDYKARSSYSSKNEYGILSESFNSLGETIENEIFISKNAADISEMMLSHENLKIFCRELLRELIKKTDSQVAAIYFLDGEKREYILYDSVGLNKEARKSFGASENEGEIGLAVVSKEIQHIREIPKDTIISFSTAPADFLPKEIITMPVISQNEVIAVISLSSINNYSDLTIRLLNEIWIVANARIAGLVASWKTHELAKKLEAQNLELEHQSKELSAQKDELSEQNIELELQKNQLDDSNRLKSTFLSNMSHELRTPLNSIIALSGVLGRRLSGNIPEEERDYIEIIERSGKNLLSLINDLLDLSRIEAGKEELNISAFKVEELINHVYEIIKPQALQKNIDLFKNIESNVPVIFSDFKKCQSILQNIAANAVKFTEAGSVEISAGVSKEMLYIKVKDTGIGIEQEKVAVIFDEFRQVDGSSSRRYEGTGLGLSISRKYAAMLNGNIEVESTAGKGSIFTINLPVKISVQSGSPLEYFYGRETENKISENSLTSMEYGSKTILIVEDSEPSVIQLRDILEHQGYKILVSRNGKEALEQLGESLPDAIILDLMMPEVDGFEVLKNIRSKEKTALIPVLILTAKHVTKQELSFLKGNNIYQLIQKGDISKSELLQAIKNMMLSHIEKEAELPFKNQSSKKHNNLERTVKAKILIVEDNPDNMKTIKALLGDRFVIFEATDGKSGFEQAKLNIPDVVLLDISLPVMDGFEVLDAIRKEEKLKTVPVFAVTASAMKGTKEEILSYGFDSYISKPVDEKILLETIEEAVFGK